MNLQEIKTAVSAGKTVLYGRAKVICDKHNQWMIVDQINKYAIGLTWEDGETMNGEESEFHVELEQQPTEKAVHDSYRSLSFVDVQAYADEHSLNIEGAENYREAAQALYAELYPPTPTAAAIEFNGVRLTAEEFLDDPTYLLVNRVELESELADAEMHRIYSPAQYQKLTQPAEDGNGTTWTEEGQEIYNDLIDYFSGIIMKCSAPTGLNEDQPAEQEKHEFNDEQLLADIKKGRYSGMDFIGLNLEETVGGDGRGSRTWELSLIAHDEDEIIETYTYFDREKAEDDAEALIVMFPTWNDDDVSYE
jgi:hypothetical protein